MKVVFSVIHIYFSLIINHFSCRRIFGLKFSYISEGIRMDIATEYIYARDREILDLGGLVDVFATIIKICT